MSNNHFTLVSLLCLNILVSVSAHTYMLSPQARYQDLCMPVFSGNSNCCAKKPSENNIVDTYARGQIISSSWGRNNHIGGFIRYAIVPLNQSDTHSVFENTDNVFQYNCFATQCVGADGFFSGDGNNIDYNQIRCSINVKIPTWLPDGYYTFQWRWHSAGDSFNVRNLGLIDFVSCHDFKIQGGPLEPKPQCPLYIGGDAAKPNLNACEFFKWNDINTCTDQYNCFSWFAKAPPKQILECPSNILPGGVNSALKGTFSQGQSEPLYIGESEHPNNNPGTSLVDLNQIRLQLRSISTQLPSTSSQGAQFTSASSTQFTSTSPTNQPSYGPQPKPKCPPNV